MGAEKYMIPCMNKQIFGFDCPGCGTQRAFMMVCKGEFSDALHLFPAIYTTLFFFLFILLHFIDKSRNYHKIIISLAIINGVIMIVSYIYKIITINQ